jgi:hypothetical protein
VTYGFTVRTVSCPEKGRFAPSIVAESNDYVRLAHALGSIRLALDPLSNDGFAYPCFVEAVDSRGIPYAAAFDVGRAGGQWARADALYPFAHG